MDAKISRLKERVGNYRESREVESGDAMFLALCEIIKLLETQNELLTTSPKQVVREVSKEPYIKPAPKGLWNKIKVSIKSFLS